MRLTVTPMVVLSILALAPLSGSDAHGQTPIRIFTQGVEAGRIALSKVCLPAILHARSVEALASAEGMLPVAASEVGGKSTDKVWRLGLIEPVYAVDWGDGSCTTIVNTGSREALRAMAESEILGRSEGFKRGSVVLVDDGRLERSTYCAQVGSGWALVSITLVGPKPVPRTRALSSTAYLRPTPSRLCTPS